MTERIGQQLGSYRLLRLLGRGGFADVYLGEHTYLHKPAALKILHIHLGEQETEQFLHEAQTLARLDHPHIVRVLDFAVQDGLPYLVMDYAIGGTLRTKHPAGTRVPLEQILTYVNQVASALQYAHDQRLVHCDIKPENMLLDVREQVLLVADFGLALLAPTRSASTQAMDPAMTGTASYLAPEQVRGQPQMASDQYALGVVVYEWLSGQRPFKGRTPIEIALQHLSAAPPPLHEQLPDLSPAVEQVVLRALAKEPEQRFPCVQDFATALHHAAHHAGSLSFTAALPMAAAAATGPAIEQEQQDSLGERPAAEPLWKVPTILTSMVGREQDVASISAMLSRPEVRLLTLLGVGGIGKTRLVIQVANQLRPRFTDGVCFVPLAPLRDPSFVLSSIAHEVGLQERGAQPLVETVKDWLRDKHFLLLLDNFEQIVSAAPLLEELLIACPHLVILVTSREALRLSAEQLFPVPPLSLPDLAQLPEHEELARYAAVCLFLQRAQAIKPDFTLTQANGRVMAEICVQLDGLPLAIELAAARIRVLAPQALLARLAQRLQVLTGGSRTLPERQQTLRNTIGWSYDLLTEGEQRLFRRISVFVGGWTLEAVEAVCYETASEASSALDEMTSLLNKSLILSAEQAGEETRLQMLMTVREYGLECLEASGESERIQRAHAAYYRAWVEEIETQLKGAEQLEWYARLERERENVFAALETAYEQDMHAELLRGVNAIARFLETRGLYAQAELGLKRARQAALLLHDTPGLATALYYLGEIAEKHGDYAQAETHLQEALVLARQAGHFERTSDILRLLGVVASRRTDYPQEELYLQEGLRLARQLDDRERISALLRSLGGLAGEQGHYAQAELYFQEGLTLARQIGDCANISVLLSNLGDIASACRNYEQAEAYLQEGLALARQVGHHQHTSILLTNLGVVAREQGNYEQAEAYLQEGLKMARQLGHRWFISAILSEWGELQLKERDADAASATFGEALQQAPEGSQDRIADALYGLARVALAQGHPVKAQQQGQESLTILEAAGHGKASEVRQWLNSLSVSVPLVSESSTPIKVQPIYPAGLTRREAEVLRLVAQGLTDAQVAEQLVISPRTVNFHLTSIYSKLGVSSRSAATRYAIEHHLV